MRFISKIFNQHKETCPRCLGKGHVDWEDIKRLKKEWLWMPGACAYCNAKGNVAAKMLSGAHIGNAYLTTDLSTEERRRLLNNDTAALERAKLFQNDQENFIKQVEYLHFIGGMESYKIAFFYFISKSPSEVTLEEKQAVIEHVEGIIKRKNEGG